MDELIFSEKEQTLLDFIKEKGEVTVKQIEEGLSASHTGALGKLLGKDLIISDKKRPNDASSSKYIKYYKIKEVKE